MLIAKKYFFSFIGILLAALLWGLFKELKHIQVEYPTAWKKEHKADCAVVLTGQSYHRIQEGISLLYKGSIKKLIISGVNPNSKLKEIFPLWDFYGGLNRDQIILEKRSTTTYGNALQTLQLTEALKCRDLVLVTSTTHMYRAKKIFEKIFPDNISIYSRSVIPGSYEPPLYLLLVEATKSLFYSLWAY